LTVGIADGHLSVCAAYTAEIGEYGAEVTRREVSRQFQLPPRGRGADVETFRHCLSPDGCVLIELVLQRDREFHCRITTEDVGLGCADVVVDDDDYDQPIQLDIDA